MTIYVVTRKSDGAEVYRYDNGVPVEWPGMEFATHDHTEEAPVAVEPAPVNPADWRIYVGPFFDRFGASKLPILASTDPVVQAVIKDASVRKYIDLHGRRGELSQALDLLIAKGFAVDKTAVLDLMPSDEEVYRGD